MSNFVYIDTDGLEKAKVIQTGDLPAGLENVQSDWNQTNNAEADYIKNKPNVITTADGLNNGDMLYWNGSAWKVTTKLKYISTLLYTNLAFMVQNDAGVKKFQVDNSTNGIDIYDSGGTYYLRIKKADGTGHTTLVFPNNNGVSGQVLVTDGFGNLTWGEGGSSLEITDILYIGVDAPTSGDYIFWWNSETGSLKVKYNDGDSTQWVDASKGAKGDTGATGANGTNGADGADGVGVPALGTTGQVLAKKSNTDYDTEWVNTHTHSNKSTLDSIQEALTTALKTNYDTAYSHSQSAHAPSDAQKNSDITKAEIEAKLTGAITSHSHAGNDTYAYCTQDRSTTGQSLVDITDLSIALSANSVYQFEVHINASMSAVNTGAKYGIQFSAAGATIEASLIGERNSTTASAIERINAFNTANVNALLTLTSGVGPIIMRGIVVTGANAGNLTAQHLKVTSGTATALKYSYMKVYKVA